MQRRVLHRMRTKLDLDCVTVINMGETASALKVAGSDNGGSAMADRDIIIGRAINVTGMIGVSAGIVLFTFGLVLLLFRRGFGFDMPNSFHWFW